MISKLPRVFCGAFVVLSSGCNLEHHAPLHTAELPALQPSVLHANRLWIDVAEHMPENACVAPGNARLLCFERFRTTLGTALTRSLWSSFPSVAVLGTQAPLDGDYVLHVDLDLEALPPDETRPGWSAGTRGSWRLERAGMVKNEALAGEQVASRSRGDFAYGAPLGIGASEVIDAVAVRIGMALGAVPESRMVRPVPLPEVATAPLPLPSSPPGEVAKPAAGVHGKTTAF
ncbi:MAG: hypothetical protein ABJB12_20260 [Pseudomonadota bacterium]